MKEPSFQRILDSPRFLVWILMFIAGCATGGSDPRTTMPGGAVGATSTGVFRGEWWNYYERGLSFLEAGRYEEAEADLHTALKRRNLDQIWVRTYGVRFLREYYPNREIGVSLFERGLFEDSVESLQKSLESRYSARAAYYVEEALKITYEGEDLLPPTIEIFSVSCDEEASFAVWISGRVLDDTFVKSVVINNQPVDVRVVQPSLEFEEYIEVSDAQAEITIRARDLFGKESVHVVAVDNGSSGDTLVPK